MIFFILYLGSLLLFVKPDTSVHILSEQYGNGQLVTSSTLNWIPVLHYSALKNFVIGGFETVENSSENLTKLKKRPIFVCRALHNGIWVAGSQKEGDKRCTVTLAGNIQSYEHYQLLENVENAARISWNDWTKFYRPPVGTVATGKLFIARHIVSEMEQKGQRSVQTHYIGTLNLQDSLGTITYVIENDNEGSVELGQLLVETEPISYELIDVNLNYIKQRIVKKNIRILGEITIKNENHFPVKMAEAIVYAHWHTLYWGQGHAMLKGLNTSITLKNKTRLQDMKWGIDIKENRSNVHTVEVYLESRTAVNVTLQGHYIEVEIPYNGTLFSNYKDKALTDPRIISSVCREESIADLILKFDTIYYLSNFSLVPSTILTSVNESSVNKIMMVVTNSQLHTKPLYLANNNFENLLKKKNVSIDRNEILINLERPEVKNILGDYSNSLLLKNNNDKSMVIKPVVSKILLLIIIILLTINRFM